MTHGHAHRPTTYRRLALTLAVTAILMLAEGVGGLLSGSLALLADAGHMLTDVLALLVALAAVALGARPADDRRTYGYRRLEILAALANGIALVVLSGSILTEALQRWMTPRPVNISVMLGVAAVGLLGNIAGLWLLGGQRANLNVRGAFLHIVGDTISSVGVLIAAVVIAFTGWTRLDAIVSVIIAVIIVVSSFALLKEVVEVLLEAAPSGMRTEEVKEAIERVEGVADVHDLHVWSISSGMPALSAHVVLKDPDRNWQQVLAAVQQRLRTLYDIDHATLQIESPRGNNCGCCWGEVHGEEHSP